VLHGISCFSSYVTKPLNMIQNCQINKFKTLPSFTQSIIIHHQSKNYKECHHARGIRHATVRNLSLHSPPETRIQQKTYTNQFPNYYSIFPLAMEPNVRAAFTQSIKFETGCCSFESTRDSADVT